MQIEVLHIAGCPTWVEASRRVREALTLSGIYHAKMAFRLVASPADAARLPFAGSPTILVDGADLFPGSPRTSQLACRVYLTPQGLAGAPTTEQIIEAVSAHGR
ncbi:thioredoxin family protein [Microbacterium sp. NEAU-LLC]|uniref:Thioredoxin family protein n=1 Tax=Microbacterium helvum TaxID=2773713 RepID=A0ABR8NQI6_9MICO|nr:thioredoxin family protein [Microbacterium helvum]MBD3942904.1 thioredoxin family protein [Microbacterium helvum]